MLGGAVLRKEGARLVGEQGVHEHVFFGRGQIADFFFDLIVGSGRQRRGSHVGRQDLGVADDLLVDFGRDGAGRLAVEAAQVILHLLGHHAPARAREHVEHGLGTHDLAHGGDQRRIAHLGAHARDFAHDLVQAVGCVLDFELRDEVAHHAARNLVRVHLHVGERRHAALVVAALAHFLPVVGDFEQQVEVVAGVVAAFLQGGDDRLDRRMAVAEGKRGARGVRDGGAGFGGLDDVHGGHASDIVAVHVHRQADFGVERLHQALGAIRREHARHVLDGDGVGAEVFELLAVFQIAVERVHGRHGVGDGALEPAAAGLDGLGVVDHVADIVERVEHAEHLDAVFLRAGDEAVHDIFRVVLVAHQVLAAREHGQIGVGHVGLDRAQALPGVLVLEPQARVERRTAPGLDRPITHLVHLGQNGQHVAELHAGGPQALLTVADSGIHQLQTWHASPLHLRSASVEARMSYRLCIIEIRTGERAAVSVRSHSDTLKQCIVRPIHCRDAFRHAGPRGASVSRSLPETPPFQEKSRPRSQAGPPSAEGSRCRYFTTMMASWKHAVAQLPQRVQRSWSITAGTMLTSMQPSAHFDTQARQPSHSSVTI